MSEIEKYRDIKNTIDLVNVKESDARKQICDKATEHTIFAVSDTFDFSKIDSMYHRFIFYHSELSFNILNNVMVPKHSKTNDCLDIKDKLPKIKTYDPVVRRMNFRIGDIIKCEYQEDTLPYYRVVTGS